MNIFGRMASAQFLLGADAILPKGHGYLPPELQKVSWFATSALEHQPAFLSVTFCSCPPGNRNVTYDDWLAINLPSSESAP
jgi:hypothetical protein